MYDKNTDILAHLSQINSTIPINFFKTESGAGNYSGIDCSRIFSITGINTPDHMYLLFGYNGVTHNAYAALSMFNFTAPAKLKLDISWLVNPTEFPYINLDNYPEVFYKKNNQGGTSTLFNSADFRTGIDGNTTYPTTDLRHRIFSRHYDIGYCVADLHKNLVLNTPDNIYLLFDFFLDTAANITIDISSAWREHQPVTDYLP